MGEGTLIRLSREQDGVGRSEDGKGERRRRENMTMEIRRREEGKVIERRRREEKNAKEGRARWKSSGEKGQY